MALRMSEAEAIKRGILKDSPAAEVAPLVLPPVVIYRTPPKPRVGTAGFKTVLAFLLGFLSGFAFALMFTGILH